MPQVPFEGVRFEGIIDEPDVILALSLSVPAYLASVITATRLQLDIDDAEVRVTIPRATARHDHVARLLSSKDTIALAILLRHLWERRFQKEPDAFVDTVKKIAWRVRDDNIRDRGHILRLHFFGERSSPFWLEIQETLGIDPQFLDEMDYLTEEVFNLLEKEGLILDPGVTASAGLMVLLGLVPVRWSVRTPKGQKVYREVKIRAGLWTLDITRIRRGKNIATDWDFNLRGVNLIQRLLREYALEYLEAERLERRDKGKPTVTLPQDLDVDGELDE